MKKISDGTIFNMIPDIQTSIQSLFLISRNNLNQSASDSLKDLVDEIRKKEKLPVRLPAISALIESKTIVPLVNREIFKTLPPLLPVLNISNMGRITTYFNIIPYVKTTDENGQIVMNRRVLLALMVGSLIVNQISNNPDKFLNNSKVLQYCATIYSRMIFKVIDRVYGISTNPVHEDQIRYLLAKFYLIHNVELTDITKVNGLAIGAINQSSSVVVQTVDNNFGSENYVNINSFINGLVQLNSKLSGFNSRKLVQDVASQYKNTGVLCIEYAPYIPMMVYTVYLNGNIFNEFTIEPMLGIEARKLVQELDRLLV